MFWEHNHRIRPKFGKVWAKIVTAMMARRSATRWRYVRGHMSAVIGTLTQHNWTPIRHTSWKDPKGKRWSLKAGGVGVDGWGLWQAFRASIEGQLWEKASRHELGTGLEGGADLTHVVQASQYSWKERAYMQPEARSWLRQRRRAGRKSDDIVQGWWSRRFARDVRKRTRTCIIEFGNAVPTQVRSLTRHGISFKKPLKPRTLECFWLCHDPALCKTRSWGSGVNLGTAYCPKPTHTSLGTALERTATRESGAWDGLQSLCRVCQTVLGKRWNAGSGRVRGS